MASVLGKRKAPAAAASSSAKKTAAATKLKKSTTKSTSVAPKKTKKVATKKVQEEEAEEDTSFADAQEIFRRHFEAQFKPIAPEPKRKKAKVEVEDDDDEEDSEGDEDVDEDVGADGEVGGEEWGGLSGAEDYDSEEEEEENTVVEVVDHTKNTPLPAPSMSKRELKAFMSSKPPSQTDSKPAATAIPADEDDEDDKSHLANDLALQRLLSESHLLARHTSMSANPSTGAAAKPFAEGKLRQRQLDLRAQALAPGVSSLFKQDKMPMAFRKGMNAVAAGKEAKRRKQAKENGIVLEREAPKKQKRSRADRSVDGPAVGRMKGAELRLSERDIQSIEGGGGRGRGGGFGGGRGGGRGRGRR